MRDLTLYQDAESHNLESAFLDISVSPMTFQHDTRRSRTVGIRCEVALCKEISADLPVKEPKFALLELERVSFELSFRALIIRFQL